MAEYSLYLCNDRGKRMKLLNNFRSFRAGKAINATAPFSLALETPSDIRTLQNYNYVINNIRPDWTVQVWSKTRGAASLWNSYFVLRWGFAQGDSGEEVFSLGGYDASQLLVRRVVAAKAEEVQAKMTDNADDMMKAIATDAMQDDADPVPTSGTRAWGDLSVQGDKGNAPSISLEFSFDSLLTLSGGGLLPKIANASRENGTDLFFAVVPATVSTKAITYQFRTYTGQPGRDLTSSVVFDADAGTLEGWALTYDYTDSRNCIYALGQGVTDDRKVEQVYNDYGYKRSYWGRCEGTINANTTGDDQLEAVGYDELAEGRAKIILTGKPVSRQGQQFGRHYQVGDKVTAKAKGQQFSALVWSAVVGQDEAGRVTEDVRLDYRE
ncbi:MAG: hypothetical protein GY832_03905 [Chloroflexi bacterium]|nr:hypothetical protein [Chloroflexota bacterium]